MSELITRQQYMQNSSELHHNYWAQFVTDATIEFVKTRIGIKKLLTSNDGGLFNDIIKHSNNGAGGWVWDSSPYNRQAMIEAGEISENCGPSRSACTCTGKAAAKILIEQHKKEA